MNSQEPEDLTGATLDQFLIKSALEKAEKIIDHEKTIHLSHNDAAMLIDMLDNPSRPNISLIRAFERFKVWKNKNHLNDGTEFEA